MSTLNSQKIQQQQACLEWLLIERGIALKPGNNNNNRNKLSRRVSCGGCLGAAEVINVLWTVCSQTEKKTSAKNRQRLYLSAAMDSVCWLSNQSLAAACISLAHFMSQPTWICSTTLFTLRESVHKHTHAQNWIAALTNVRRSNISCHHLKLWTCLHQDTIFMKLPTYWTVFCK